jgi:endo-1,4-beta-xylanase
VSAGFCLLLTLFGCSSSSTDDGGGAPGNNDGVSADNTNTGDTGGGATTPDDGMPTGDGNTGSDIVFTGDGAELSVLPQPPLTPAPDNSSEPQRINEPVSTVTEFFLVRDPPGDYEDVDPTALTDEDFAAGPLPPVIFTPESVDPASNQPPRFVDLEDQVVLAGSTMELLLKPVDPDGGFAGMFPGTLPVGSNYIDNFDGTRTLRWRPLQPDVGITEFTITAVDPVVPMYRTERTIRIKVELPADTSTIVNLPPTINGVRPHTVRVNDPVVIEIKGADANGTIPDLEVSNLPAGATFIAHYNEPAIRVLRFIPQATGEITIDVTARDEVDPELTGQRTITIDVLADADFTRPGSRLRSLATSRDFLIGYASLQRYYHRPDGAIYADIAAGEFNFVTTENTLKWSLINPVPGRYRWAGTDNLVSFAKPRGLKMHGHTLVWHRQLPGWVVRSAVADRETHMREYIDRVLTRYSDDIQVWDVVNEALEEDGSMRQSVWLEAMGPDYIDIAFRQARASAPDATLLYNDYDVAWQGAKSDGLFKLLQALQDLDTPLDGVGFQMHLFAKFDQYNEVAENFQRVADMGLDIYITELDVSMNGDDTQTLQAEVYERVLSLCLEQPRCKALQTWGFTDMYSWRREFKPLLLDETYQVKPAYLAIQQRLSEN